MSNSLTKHDDTQLDQISEIAGGLPAWLAILIGAYPNSWASELTYMVLERAFASTGESILATAVGDYIQDSDKFPTVASLRPYVERYAPDYRRDLARRLAGVGYVSNGEVTHALDRAWWPEGTQAPAVQFENPTTGQVVHIMV